MTTPNSNSEQYPSLIPKPLQVQYDPGTDSLIFGNGTPASNGHTVAQCLMVFYDEDDDVQLVTLENASKLLLALRGQQPAAPNSERL